MCPEVHGESSNTNHLVIVQVATFNCTIGGTTHQILQTVQVYRKMADNQDIHSTLQTTRDGQLIYVLTVYIQPNAKSTQVIGWVGSGLDRCLKIKLAAPPIDGKANQALIDWLAKQCQCPKSAIVLKRGERSRRKTVWIPAHAVNGTTLEAIWHNEYTHPTQ